MSRLSQAQTRSLRWCVDKTPANPLVRNVKLRKAPSMIPDSVFAWFRDYGITPTQEFLDEPFLLHLLATGCQTKEELTSLLRANMRDPGTAMWALFGRALEVSGEGQEPLDTAPCDEELLVILCEHIDAIVRGLHQLTIIILGKQERALELRDEQNLVTHVFIHAMGALIAHLRDTVPSHTQTRFLEAANGALDRYRKACWPIPSDN